MKKEKKEVLPNSETPAEAMESPKSEAIDWEAKANEYLNDLKRTQADFENYKKRLAREQGEMKKFMIQGLLADLIPILDNFHAAITHVPEAEKASPWVTGITYIEKQFEEVLGNYGVHPLDVKPDDPFDPAQHEALEMRKEDTKNQNESNDTHPRVTKVVQKGYKIGDKVVRAAKVIVN